MGWRVRKSVTITKGIRINVSNKDVSVTLGGKDFKFNADGPIGRILKALIAFR